MATHKVTLAPGPVAHCRSSTPGVLIPDKSLLKTSQFTSELLPLQKGKLYFSVSPSYFTNSPLAGQQPLMFPIPQILNYLSKEVPGSRQFLFQCQ